MRFRKKKSEDEDVFQRNCRANDCVADELRPDAEEFRQDSAMSLEGCPDEMTLEDSTLSGSENRSPCRVPTCTSKVSPVVQPRRSTAVLAKGHEVYGHFSSRNCVDDSKQRVERGFQNADGTESASFFEGTHAQKGKKKSGVVAPEEEVEDGLDPVEGGASAEEGVSPNEGASPNATGNVSASPDGGTSAPVGKQSSVSELVGTQAPVGKQASINSGVTKTKSAKKSERSGFTKSRSTARLHDMAVHIDEDGIEQTVRTTDGDGSHGAKSGGASKKRPTHFGNLMRSSESVTQSTNPPAPERGMVEGVTKVTEGVVDGVTKVTSLAGSMAASMVRKSMGAFMGLRSGSNFADTNGKDGKKTSSNDTMHNTVSIKAENSQPPQRNSQRDGSFDGGSLKKKATEQRSSVYYDQRSKVYDVEGRESSGRNAFKDRKEEQSKVEAEKKAKADAEVKAKYRASVAGDSHADATYRVQETLFKHGMLSGEEQTEFLKEKRKRDRKAKGVQQKDEQTKAEHKRRRQRRRDRAEAKRQALQRKSVQRAAAFKYFEKHFEDSEGGHNPFANQAHEVGGEMLFESSDGLEDLGETTAEEEEKEALPGAEEPRGINKQDAIRMMAKSTQRLLPINSQGSGSQLDIGVGSPKSLLLAKRKSMKPVGSLKEAMAKVMEVEEKESGPAVTRADAIKQLKKMQKSLSALEKTEFGDVPITDDLLKKAMKSYKTVQTKKTLDRMNTSEGRDSKGGRESGTDVGRQSSAESWKSRESAKPERSSKNFVRKGTMDLDASVVADRRLAPQRTLSADELKMQRTMTVESLTDDGKEEEFGQRKGSALGRSRSGQQGSLGRNQSGEPGAHEDEESSENTEEQVTDEEGETDEVAGGAGGIAFKKSDPDSLLYEAPKQRSEAWMEPERKKSRLRERLGNVKNRMKGFFKTKGEQVKKKLEPVIAKIDEKTSLQSKDERALVAYDIAREKRHRAMTAHAREPFSLKKMIIEDSIAHDCFYEPRHRLCGQQTAVHYLLETEKSEVYFNWPENNRMIITPAQKKKPIDETLYDQYGTLKRDVNPYMSSTARAIDQRRNRLKELQDVMSRTSPTLIADMQAPHRQKEERPEDLFVKSHIHEVKALQLMDEQAYDDVEEAYLQIEADPTWGPNTKFIAPKNLPTLTEQNIMAQKEVKKRKMQGRRPPTIWVKEESRKNRGFYYWINQTTGETRWEDASFPLTGEIFVEHHDKFEF